MNTANCYTWLLRLVMSYLIKALLSILCCFRVVECHRSWGIQPPTMKIFSLADARRCRIHVEWQTGRKGHKWIHSDAHTSTRGHSLMGAVKGPAPPVVLAMTRSAICLSAMRPVGLLPLVSWSWIRPSNSSLNTCKQNQIKLFYSRRCGTKNLKPSNSCTRSLSLSYFQHLHRMCGEAQRAFRCSL